MERVLITGGRAPVALDLARHFAHAGIEVTVADSVPLFLTRASNAAKLAVKLPSPRYEFQEFIAAINRIVHRQKISLIVPTCEEVFYLAFGRKHLPSNVRVFCPAFETLQQLHSKWHFGALAAGRGIEVPKTWLIYSDTDIQRLPVATTDLVFKPEYSRFAVETLIRPLGTELQRIRFEKGRAWIAQTHIKGRELCSYSIAHDGRLVAHSLYMPTWRAGRSSGFYFESIESTAIVSFVTNLIAELGYTGQIAFDFIEDETGQIFVLECNPRATSGLHLFQPGDGIATAFVSAVAHAIRPQSSATPRMLSTAMLISGLPQAIRRRLVPRFVHDYLRAKDVLWSHTDPLPAFQIFVSLTAFAAHAVYLGISPSAAATRDIEWDGDAIT